MLKRRQMCTAECAKILRRYNEMRLTSNDQRRRPSPTPKYRGSGLKRLRNYHIPIFIFISQVVSEIRLSENKKNKTFFEVSCKFSNYFISGST